MSKIKKLILKIQNGPNNVTIDELLLLMRHHEFQEKRNPHGYMFIHPKLKDIILPHAAEPNGANNKVLVTYVKECLKAIELLNEMEDEL